VLPCAASTLVSHLLDQPVDGWREAARTSVSVHYETNDRAVPVVCVATPAAVRLPHSLVVPALPTGAFRPAVTRWWTPDRPTALDAPHPSRWAAWLGSRYDDLDPHALLGRGPGLTPAGDDVLAGALVAAHALRHPGLATWRRATTAALTTRRTTAVSVGMLHSALDGWAAPELAGALTALCGDDDPAPAVQRLLAVGHSSGRHLLDGVLHVLSTARHPAYTEGAA
jgi:hypothetical protein